MRPGWTTACPPHPDRTASASASHSSPGWPRHWSPSTNRSPVRPRRPDRASRTHSGRDCRSAGRSRSTGSQHQGPGSWPRRCRDVRRRSDPSSSNCSADGVENGVDWAESSGAVPDEDVNDVSGGHGQVLPPVAVHVAGDHAERARHRGQLLAREPARAVAEVEQHAAGGAQYLDDSEVAVAVAVDVAEARTRASANRPEAAARGWPA